MAMIEPNVAALAWFAGFAAIAGLGFYVVTGAFPLSTRDDLKRHPAGVPLAFLNALGFVALVVGAAFYGVEHLRWSSVVIVAGLAALFAPALLQILPQILPQACRDGVAGLALMLALTAAAIGALQIVGGVFLA